jgi:transposase InsO family protein
VRAKRAPGKSLEDAIAEALEQPILAPNGQPITAKPRTVRTWVNKFDEGGAEALERRGRTSGLISTVLPANLIAFLRAEKKQDRYASVPELLRRARQLDLLAPDAKVDRTSVWRAVARMGLPMRRVPSKREGEQRPFEYAHRMMMVLADGKHFRAGVQRQKRVALFFLDDATRYGLDVVVGTSEHTALFLRGVHRVIERYGYFDSIYLDRGPGFRSYDTAAVMARLRCNLILGTAGYPEGHGKIERFNQTAVGQVLRGLSGNAEVDDDPLALELRLRHWLWALYDQQPHEALGEAA